MSIEDYDMDDYSRYLEYSTNEDKMLTDEPMISYDSFIDRFILDANGRPIISEITRVPKISGC